MNQKNGEINLTFLELGFVVHLNYNFYYVLIYSYIKSISYCLFCTGIFFFFYVALQWLIWIWTLCWLIWIWTLCLTLFYLRACYGVLRFIMESGAKGCEVVVSGKLRGQRAKSMKFVDGLMIHSGDPVNYYVDTAVRHVLLRQGEYSSIGDTVALQVCFEVSLETFCQCHKKWFMKPNGICLIGILIRIHFWWALKLHTLVSAGATALKCCTQL